MRREQICSLLAVVMTAAFFIVLLWGYGQYQQNRRAMTLLENEYQRAYYNYLADVRDMALSAGKAHSGDTLQQAVLLSRLQARAETAANQLARLPVRQSQYQRSLAYLNQLGGYANSLTQSLAHGNSLDEADRRGLGQIYGQLNELYTHMEDMERQVAGGEIVFAVAEGGWWQAARSALSGSRAAQGAAAAAEEKTADAYFSRANALLEEVEPLTYAGKYSAHISSLPARGLSGTRRISAEQALTAAREFLDLAGQGEARLTEQTEIQVGESLPMYDMRFSNEAQQNIYVAASQAGGKIISYACERPLAGARLTAEDAIDRAEALLRRVGYADLQLASRQRVGEALLLFYVPLQEGVLCYPDAVEMSVALDDGALLMFNAQPYWRNNHARPLPAEQALAQAQAEGTALAYISDGAGGEKLCFELRHSVDGEEYLTYTGVESMLGEQVLRNYSAGDGSFYTR